MKILVVDDDPVILDLVPTVLRQEGHDHIQVASSGTTALDILHKSSEIFDVLILDIEMPGMDGIALTASIRKIPLYSSTPIIMLTAKSDANSIESAFSAGANDYITKPFDIKSIGNRILIAERMMRDSCNVVTLESLSDTLQRSCDAHVLDIENPVRISGLPQHTDPFSLGNYLSQLTRKKVDETSIFSLKIDMVKDLHDELSSRELLMVIAEVSNAISAATNDERLLGTYIGSGKFIYVATGDLLDVWWKIEQRVDNYLARSKLLRDAGHGGSITVTMARPFRPNASKTKRVRATFDRAISQLERRVKLSAMAN